MRRVMMVRSRRMRRIVKRARMRKRWTQWGRVVMHGRGQDAVADMAVIVLVIVLVRYECWEACWGGAASAH
jgi:hypothetical protein